MASDVEQGRFDYVNPIQEVYAGKIDVGIQKVNRRAKLRMLTTKLGWAMKERGSKHNEIRLNRLSISLRLIMGGSATASKGHVDS